LHERPGPAGDGPLFGAVRRLVFIGAVLVLTAWVAVIAIWVGIRLIEW
jgi:hypothetical protein